MATKAQIELAQRLAWDCGIVLGDMPGVAGYRTTRWVRTFQDAFQLDRWAHNPLRPDGDPGPQTEAALVRCFESGRRVSENFGFAEFRTKGSKNVSFKNHGIRVTRLQVASLQALRDLIGQPLFLLSTYRDPDHNRAIGGASRSQHLFGKGADIDRPRTGREITEAEARKCGFGGVGMLSSSRPGRDVIHVDTRASSARWFYTS